MAGITSHQYCLQMRYSSVSMEGGIEQKKASRHCDENGKWRDANYTDCHYTNGITRVLHTFILVRAIPQFLLMFNYVDSFVQITSSPSFIFALAFQRPINVSNAVTLAHQVRTYTLEAAGFTDSVDVLYVAQMMEKFMEYVKQLREVRHYELNVLKQVHVCDVLSRLDYKFCVFFLPVIRSVG